jgi:hypothetical protein
MTTTEYTPLLRDGSSRSSATQHHLPISSHYFDITDIESWPIAGLLVLLDGQGLPVRAELHLYDDLQPHVQEAAIRQARLVLQERYLGGAPVPVRILETFQVREEMLVRLPPVGARPSSVPALPLRWRQYGMIGAAVLGLLLLVLIVNAFLPDGDSGAEQVASNAATALDQAGGQDVVAEAQAIDAAADESTEAAAEAPAAPSELPVSRNARSDLGIGVRVQVVPPLRVALRSEPGADRGIVVGELAEGDVATIVAGPEYSQGETDTIVWWLLALSNGTQAWAAANTSQQTLLMPAQ